MLGDTIWIAIVLVVGAVAGAWAWHAGSARAAARERDAFREALGRLAPGRGGPTEGTAGEVVREALREGWIRRASPSAEDVRRAAVGRVVAYLRGAVAEPLQRALEEEGEGSRAALDEAVGALADLEFYARSREPVRLRSDLTRLAREVVREFVGDAEVAVKERLPGGPVYVMADSEGLRDALYLILHNAAEFGDGAAISLTVEDQGATGRVTIRDRGPGFSPEAFRRATDPFYSTTESGLGLGLAHAREELEAMGATLELRNHPEGGAEVEVTLAKTG